MPLNLVQATQKVHKMFPTGKIDGVISYRDLFVFQVTIPRPGETGMDPYYSVDPNTGAVREFSIFTDGDINEVMKLFMESKGNRR